VPRWGYIILEDGTSQHKMDLLAPSPSDKQFESGLPFLNLFLRLLCIYGVVL
jgi:hypothetical protein